MANSTSANLKLTVQATGENSGTWGQITNTNLLILEQAIGGYAAINSASGATLTFSNGALSDGKNQVLKLTGTISGNVNVTIPDSIEKTYIVENATSGAHTVTFKTSSGTGITWSATDKGKKILYSDGTNIEEGVTSADNLLVSGNVTFVSNASITGNANVTGDLDVDGTANLDVTDIDGALTQDGGAVFNEDSADVDFRVESNTNQHMLFVDAGNDRIGINTSTPTETLEVNGNCKATAFEGDGSSLTGIYSNSDALSLFNVSGSAPVYACRAWVNFNGIGTPSISGSGNVSSITDNGTGDYTANFTTNMQDANYAVSGSADYGSEVALVFLVQSQATSNVRVNIDRPTVGRKDSSAVMIAIHR